MSIRKSTLILLIFLVVGLWYFVSLANRLNGDLILMIVNYIFLAGVIIIGNARYKQLVNPVALLAPLMLGFVYYGLMISNRQVPLSSTVYVSYYLFVLAFVVGCMIPFRLRYSRALYSHKYSLLISDILLLIASVVFLAEAILSGGFPLLNLILFQMNSYADMKLIPVAHYFVMLTALLPALYYHSYKAGKISRLRMTLCLLLVAFILLNTLSRQIMIFGFITFYFAYRKLNNVKESRLVFTALVLAIVLFLVVGEFRMGAVDSLDFLKVFSDVPTTLPVNTFEVTFNLYSSLNFNTFNTLVREVSSFYFGAYTFRPLLDITQVNNIFEIGIPDSRDTFKMLATIIADPYLDFGLTGVLIFGFGYGIFGSYAFSAYMSRANAAFTLLWATFAYAMVMGVFTNYFNVFFIWLCIGLSWVLFVQPGRK
jgi:oligosaccharide repeat unit polymerase